MKENKQNDNDHFFISLRPRGNEVIGKIIEEGYEGDLEQHFQRLRTVSFTLLSKPDVIVADAMIKKIIAGQTFFGLIMEYIEFVVLHVRRIEDNFSAAPVEQLGKGDTSSILNSAISGGICLCMGSQSISERFVDERHEDYCCTYALNRIRLLRLDPCDDPSVSGNDSCRCFKSDGYMGVKLTTEVTCQRNNFRLPLKKEGGAI